VRARQPGRRLFTPGILPYAASQPASLFAPLLRRSGYFFFAVEEKVTRSPQASGSFCFKTTSESKTLDSRFRGNDDTR
jgi:hypothetical protein